MSNLVRTLAPAAVLAIALATAPAVYAEQNSTPDTNGSHMGTSMRHGGTMGMQGAMTARMSEMMEGCSNMMQNQNRPPNSQFHKPSQPSPKD
jgi:hypothetical protein